MIRLLQALKDYCHPSLLRIMILGFASGIPLPLTLSNLTTWLMEAGISKSSIGLFAAVGIPYSLKFLWSHAVDHLPLWPLNKILGKRRSWIIVTQILLVMAIIMLGFSDPQMKLMTVACLAFAVSSLSATQDIAIDAFRIESIDAAKQAEASAMYVLGYRVAMLVAGAGGLLISQYFSWKLSYIFAAGCLLPGIIIILLAKEPSAVTSADEIKIPEFKEQIKSIVIASGLGISSYLLWMGLEWLQLFTDSSPILGHILKPLIMIYSGVAIFMIIGLLINMVTGKSLAKSSWEPFRAFTQKPEWVVALLFILLFKFGDAFAGIMTNPFLIDIGFTKEEIAWVVKSFGFAALLAGAFVGGIMSKNLGHISSLWIAGILQLLSNLLFCVQAVVGHNIPMLFVTIGVENFTGSMGITAFVGYISGLCQREYSATQFALLSSLAAVARSLLVALVFYIDQIFFPGSSFIDNVGWANFFIITAVAAVPGLMMLVWLRKAENKYRTA